MIGKVTRGQDVARLLAYLYGPGRYNEHINPHLVAGFRLPAALEPELKPSGDRDLRYLAAALSSPLDTLRHTTLDRPVWQCSIRAAPGDRLLSDAEWADVAEEVVHATGFAPRGDDRACPWIAVRHADDHIHIAVVLAREDGRNPSVRRDYVKVRSACRTVEERYGLTQTAPADRTATPRPTRAEVEQAQRKGRSEPPRDTLRRAMVAASTGAASEAEFFASLRAEGLLVRQRFSRRNPGEVTGYAVSLSGHTNQDGDPVWFSGGKLAPELTLPKLRDRWSGGPGGPSSGQSAATGRQPGGRAGGRTGGRLTPAERSEVYQLAARTAAVASQQMRWNTDADARADLASAASDVLHVTAGITDNRQLAWAADSYARCAREPYGRRPAPTRHGTALRAAGRVLAVLGIGRGDRRQSFTVELLMLLGVLADLAATFAEHRQAQQRHAQADAARKAAACLRGIGRPPAEGSVAQTPRLEAPTNAPQLAAAAFPAPLAQHLGRVPLVDQPSPRRPSPTPGPNPGRRR